MHENFSLPFRRRLCHPSGAMIHAKLTHLALPLSLAGLLLVAGCNKNQSPQNAEQPAASQPAPASSPEASTPATPNATAGQHLPILLRLLRRSRSPTPFPLERV